ncbi:hypothetical protein FB639_002179 [Coemansia asiatica]|nr:hypothetical protein FB639_002179 [Coemansia asiatica]
MLYPAAYFAFIAAATVALVSAHPVQDNQCQHHGVFRRQGSFNAMPISTAGFGTAFSGTGAFVPNVAGFGFGTGFGTGFGFGFPFASNFVNRFDANAFNSNFNDDTLFAHNVNANVASDNVNTFNSANVIA